LNFSQFVCKWFNHGMLAKLGGLKL